MLLSARRKPVPAWAFHDATNVLAPDSQQGGSAAMIVTMQNKGRSITGLRIGASNVRRYFHSHRHSIDLELDHLRIRCELQASFWRDQPEITDRRLCSWLESKFFWLTQPEPVSVEMVPTGDSYRLQFRRPARHRLH